MTSKIPERKKFTCDVNTHDSITLEGPDSDGDLTIEIDVTEDAITLNTEKAIEVRDYLDRFIQKVKGE